MSTHRSGNLDLQNYSKLVQLSFSGLVTRAGGSGKGGRDGERGGCKYLGQIYRCIVGFLALKLPAAVTSIKVRVCSRD